MEKIIRRVPSALLVFLLFVVVFSFTPNQSMSRSLPSASVERSFTEKAISVTDVDFYQVNLNISGTATPNSGYGIIELDFTGSRQIEYLNLNCNGTWVIRNAPLLSVGGEESGQSQRFWFSLGVADGVEVTYLDYGYTLTPQIQEAIPDRDSEALVADVEYLIFNGGADVQLDPTWPQATVVIGSIVTDVTLHVKNNVPNQEAGLYECAPTAVSNSLQYLNTHHTLGIDPAELTIEKMKDACDFMTGLGCYIWPNPARPEGHQEAWYEDKAAYIQEMGWPISTKRIDPANIAQVIAEIDACEDIEMEIGGHTVTVVGMADLGGGNYSVTIQHDTNQGNAGGCVTESAIWNSNTNTWSGALAGWTINYFIVESPISVEIPGHPWPALILGLVIALTLILAVRRRKNP
jgi:hypothetical protein